MIADLRGLGCYQPSHLLQRWNQDLPSELLGLQEDTQKNSDMEKKKSGRLASCKDIHSTELTKGGLNLLTFKIKDRLDVFGWSCKKTSL